MGVALGVLLKLSPSVLSAPLISSAPALSPTIHCRSFLASPHNVLSTPHSSSVSGQHAISFLLAVVILIVCFPCFPFDFLFFFFDFVYICLFFHCYFLVRFLLFVPFILLFFSFLSFYFPICFFFPTFACNKALSSQIVFCS